jgi:RimJ/RimL family protein N-acetyltransferase
MTTATEATRPTTVDPESQLWVLDDGRAVTIVPIQASDSRRLVRFPAQLSPVTTYRRFFCVHPELSRGEVERFTRVDHERREALLAVSAGEIVGVARLERLTGTTRAEVAFVVADSWQGHGLGTLLFQRLAARATTLGITTFVAETQPDNAAMLAVFRRFGGVLRIREGLVDVSVDLG